VGEIEHGVGINAPIDVVYAATAMWAGVCLTHGLEGGETAPRSHNELVGNLGCV
jgi:hypothetical protein